MLEKYLKPIGELFTIVNKDKIEVSFTPNRPQEHLLRNCDEKTVVLKARKMGFSSIILAVGVLKFLFGENERIVSMSFDADASTKQLDRAKHFLKSYGLKRGIDVPTKYNSKKELVREGITKEGRPYVNTMRVGTAKSSSFGRGDDITFLHLTEVAFCDDLDALRSGVTQALINNAPCVFETTANGFCPFKTFWDQSKEGLTGFKPLFYGADWEYSKEVIAENRKEVGHLGIQEYPLTDIEAFITSGELYFDHESLARYLEEVKDAETI